MRSSSRQQNQTACGSTLDADSLAPDQRQELIDEVKAAILDYFRRSRGNRDTVVPPQWLIHGLIPNLSPVKKRLFPEAIDALIADGMVTIERECFGNAFLALTDRGATEIKRHRA